jgi:outer membrane protein assembly factor BamB
MPNGIWASPAYFNGTVYYAGVRDTLKAYPIVNGRLTGPLPRQSATVFAYPGATPAISAFGTSNAIVWVVQSNGSVPCLHAYRADDLSQELYNSNQAPLKRDHFGPSNKFIVPTVVNGKVFVGTQDGVVIFGLLHPN